MTAWAPSSAALEIAIVIPRSLNDPVGLAPSTLSQTSQPVRRDSSCAGTRGGAPPWRGTTGVLARTRSRARAGSLRPGHTGGAAPPAGRRVVLTLPPHA